MDKLVVRIGIGVSRIEGTLVGGWIGLVIGDGFECSIFLACLVYFFSIAVCSASNHEEMSMKNGKSVEDYLLT